MVNVTFMNMALADPALLNSNTPADYEAFFMFLADSIDENGELLTPLDFAETEEHSSIVVSDLDSDSALNNHDSAEDAK